MKVSEKGHSVTIKDTQGDLSSFLNKLTNQYKTFETFNIVIDLLQYNNLSIEEIKQFSLLAKQHKKAKKSLVIVVSNIDYNAIPDKLTVVPSLLEAHDIIEMEEIERDLGF
tara:strand:- start:2011 stop:2343 length:333 start_codon:yes stop_codon:yes gene_type:complete